MIKYFIDDKEYNSLWALRRDYPYLIFSNDASDDLLAEIGITKQEVQDPEPSEQQEFLQAKAQRSQDVNEITVTVDGLEFDGNEIAQSRMLRTINAMESGTVKWVLHNNTVQEVTIEQLKEALKLSVQAMNEIWIKPYTDEQ